MPITRGSTPATALPANAPSGSTPSSRAFSSDAITSAAAPSLMPDEFRPSRFRPRGTPASAPRASRRSCRAADARRASTSPTGTSSSSKRPASARRRPAALRLERERVLILARHAPPLGDVLARLAHRLEREHRLEPRIGKAPAERRVPRGLVAARKRRVGLGHRERRARHRLDAAGDEEVAVARHDGMTGRRRRRRAPTRTACSA